MDKYLSHLVRNCDKGTGWPSLYQLGATSLLIAAKIEQPIMPSFTRMISLMPEDVQAKTSKQNLIDLEQKMLTALQFNMSYVSPVAFLARYQRLLGIDQESQNQDWQQIGGTARDICKYMQRYSVFLSYRPSQWAATALMLAINLSMSPVSLKLGLTRLSSPASYKHLQHSAGLCHDGEEASDFD